MVSGLKLKTCGDIDPMNALRSQDAKATIGKARSSIEDKPS